MRTYSKRLNRITHKNVVNNVVANDQTAQKRVRHSEAEERPRKKQKLIDRLAMSGTFETPHPTLQASSHVYRLPSTKPIPSPTPFSPVPITAPIQSLDVRTRPNFAPTTSGALKENMGSNKSTRQRKSSKPRHLSTLTIGSGSASHKSRENGRSPSRSSNSASSSSRARFFKSKSKLFKKFKFKPNSSSNDLSERHSFTGSKSLTRKQRSMPQVSNGEQNLLASPFTSRAPSPMGFDPDVAKSESVGQQALAGSKLLPDSRGRGKVKKPLSESINVLSSPEKLGTKKRSSEGLFDRRPVKVKNNQNEFSWKNRRPSAPSSLQKPPKPIGKAHVPAKKAEKLGSKRFKEENETDWQANEPQNTISRRVDSIYDSDNALGVELIASPDPFFWMQGRTAVDFNRPPSQLSFRLSPCFHRLELEDAEAGVFWSSGDEDDDGNDLGANPEAIHSARPTSTPYKEIIARRPSLPIVRGSNIVSIDQRDSGKPRSMSADFKTNTSVGHNDQNRDDMELTIPLDCGQISEKYQKDSVSFQDHTPWITDSIISPPTAYFERKRLDLIAKAKGVDENVKEERPVLVGPLVKLPTSPSSTRVRMQTGGLSSSFESYTESTSPHVGLGSHESTYRTEDGGIADVQSQGPSQRTRSGTILAARNGATIARRTRTGTIVGPSTTGRTRSGTIVAKVKPEQSVAVGETRGTRSGSIIEPVPDLSASGRKGLGLRTGSVAKIETTKISDIVGVEEEIRANSDGSFIQINNACSDSIEELNEAECYVDSLYLASSPDPINFLTGARVHGDESALVVAVGEWQVADEPPSPDIWRTMKTIRTPRALGGRSSAWRFKPKGNRKNRARSLSADGRMDSHECDDNNENGLSGLSDDELLLVEGQSQSLFD